VKLFADGGSCGKVALSEEFVAGGGLGDLWHTTEELTALIAEADSRGYQVVVHALGDRATTSALDAFAAVLDGRENTLRHRIDHNALITDESLPRYGEIGIVAALFGWFGVCADTTSTPFFERTTFRWRDLLDANPGLHVAWHGDDPWIGPISPLMELHSMVTRTEIAQDGTMCPTPEYLADQVLTVDEGLAMMTTGAAYALDRDTEVGSIAPGKLADFVILDVSPRAVEPDQIPTIVVLATMVGGRTEFCAAGAAVCP
jgi:hypothetical protein